MTHDKWQLQSMQVAPLSVKISLTKQRIREWVNHWGEDHVYVSFSGGKDSTVLLRLAREEYPNMKAVFVDTGLEYPEIRKFVRTYDNVDWVRPKKTFKQVIEEYGYPMISKEVSECVSGARKYLTQLRDMGLLDDRQTDRQVTYRYFYDKLCGFGKYDKSFTGGGDNKYRKLRGIGEYSRIPSKGRGTAAETGKDAGDAVGVGGDKEGYP